MSDTSDRIARILEDPESVKMITEIAQGLMNASSEGDIGENVSKEEPTSSSDSKAVSQDDNNIDALSILHFIEGRISPTEIDNTIRLIQALRPYLGRRRSDSTEAVLKLLFALKTVMSINSSTVGTLLTGSSK